MPQDIEILAGVKLDPQSLSATEARLKTLLQDRSLNLKINSNFALGQITSSVREFDKSLASAQARILAFTAGTTVLYGLVRAAKEVSSAFIDTEQRLKSIQVLLSPTIAQFQNFTGALFAISRDTGKSFGEVSDAANELARQGLKIQEVLSRTSDALKLSRQSGLSAAESVTALTSAINTFNKEALTSTDILNKLANVDANFAVSSKDLVQAISRSGAAAQDAGVSFNKLLAFTTSLQQTTARGGAVIGNALKSIFTRVERSSTLDALEQFNVQTRDLQGNILSADKVLQNLANTYKTLARSEQVAISERVAGIQQINQLKALLGDLAHANSVYSRSLATAGENTNAAIERNKLLNQTLATQLNALKSNATEFSSIAGKLVFQPVIKNLATAAGSSFALGGLTQKEDESKSAGQKIGEGVLRGIGQALSGPGLIVGVSLLANILKGLGQYTGGVLTSYASLTNSTKQQAVLQGAINQILATGNSSYIRRLAAAKSIKEEEEAIKSIMLQINGLSLQRDTRLYAATKNLASAKNSLDVNTGSFNVRAAGGYLPVAEEQRDIQRGVGGASAGARPKIIPNFNFGGGRRGTVVANTDEYIVPNYAGGDGSAIFNQQMAKNYGLPPGAQKIHAAGGLIPNYFNKYSKSELGYSGALIDKSYRYIYDDNGNVDLAKRLAARKRGFELLTDEDAQFVQSNSEILKGHSLKVIDPTESFRDDFKGSHFNVLAAKPFIGDKLQEAQLSKFLPKSADLKGFLKQNRTTGKNQGRLLDLIRKQFGNNFFIKGKEGAQGDSVYDSRVAPYYLNEILAKKDDFYLQKGIENISNREFRVTAAGVGNRSRLVGGALLRSQTGDDGIARLNHEFIGGAVKKDKLFSREGFENILSRYIANKQGLRAFNSLPANIRAGGVAGLDVLETGNTGIKKFGQAAAELLGLGRYIKGGGVAEFNFSQGEETANKHGGQPGSSGSFARPEILTAAAQALIDNNGGFAKGYVPSGKEKIEYVQRNKVGTNSSGYYLVKTNKRLFQVQAETASEARKAAKADIEHRPLNLASGYTPNYNNLSHSLLKSGASVGSKAKLLAELLGGSLGSAVNREHSAGIPYSQIKIEKSAELIDSLNPQGLAVTNTRDEPGGINQGISRAKRQGLNPKTYGVADGLIPNYADPGFTAGQLGTFGSEGGENLVRKVILGYIKNAKISEQDLALPKDQLKQTLKNTIIHALNLDPRTITASQGVGLEKIADLQIRQNRGSLKQGYYTQLDNETKARLAAERAAKQAETAQHLLDQFANSAAQKDGLFRGGSRINKLQSGLFGSSTFKDLDEEHQFNLKSRTNDISISLADRRRQRAAGLGIGASLALPILANTLTSLAPQSSVGARKFNAVGEGLGAGLSTASVLGFSPVGLAAGGAIGSLTAFVGIVNASRKSLEDYSKEIEDTKGRFEQNRNNVGGAIQAQEQLKDIIEAGGSKSEISRVSNQIQDLIKNIDDPKIRNRFIGASTADQKSDILQDLAAQQIKATSQKGLQGILEEVFTKNRNLLSQDKRNVLLTNEQRNDVGGFISNALPLSLDENKRKKQLAGLQDLSASGDVSLGGLQKVLGKLNIDNQSLDKFKKLASVEQEAIIKNVIGRAQSAAAIEKETQSLKTYTSSLLSIQRTLDRLTQATSFRLGVADIKTQGARTQAITGAQQSLSSIGEFLSPESRNRQENRIKQFELENDRINNINKISVDFADSIKDLPEIVQKAFKVFESDQPAEGGGIFGRSEKFKGRTNQIILKSLSAGDNPSDIANTIVANLGKYIKELGGPDSKENGKVAQSIQDVVNNKITIPIQLEQERAAQRKALQDNTNRLNELNISLNKKTNFLGGGNFENTANLDFSKIGAGLGQGRAIRNVLTNPFDSRLYKSRDNSFDDFFRGRPIDTDAETARRSRVYSTLGSGRLQAFQAGLFDGNPQLINETRGIVSKAEQSTIQTKLNQLIKSGRNTGDLGLVDQLRSFSPDKVKEIADLRALKQVPLDDKTRQGLEERLEKVNSLLSKSNLPSDLKGQLQGTRRGLENELGPDGVFKELNSQLTNLSQSFNEGVKGDFKQLIDSSEEAAKALSDLSSVAKLLKQGDKEQSLSDKIVDLNSQKAQYEKRKQGLLEKDTLDQNSIDKINANGPSRSVFGRKLDIGKTASALQISPKLVEQFTDLGEKYRTQENYKPADFLSELSSTIPDRDIRNKLTTQQYLASSLEGRFHLNGFSPDLSKASDNQRLIAKKQAGQLNKQIDNLHGPEHGTITDSVKELESKIQKIQDELNSLGTNSSGLLPTYSKGLLNSLHKEKQDIFRGVGGAIPSDKPYLTNVTGIGPAVVNTGESIVKNFAGTGKDAVLNRKMKQAFGINSYADGEIPNIDVGKIPEKALRYGEELVFKDDFDKIIKAYKTQGISGIKKCLNQDKEISDKLIANKADGEIPDPFKLPKSFYQYKSPNIANLYPTTLGEKYQKKFDQLVDISKLPHPAINSDSYSLPPSSNIFQPKPNYVPTLPQIPSGVSDYFKKTIDTFQNNKNNKRNFDVGQSIFGNNTTLQRNRIFASQFQGGAGYEDLDIKDQINRRPSLLSTGSLKNVSIQGSGGLDRIPLRARNADENEDFYRRNRRGNDKRYNDTIQSGSFAGNNADKLSQAADKLIAFAESQAKKAGDKNQGEAITVDQKINVQINGTINVNNDKIKSIVDEEIAKANENIKARVAALEEASKKGEPVKALPPKAPNNQGGDSGE